MYSRGVSTAQTATLIEAQITFRYHVGESLVPSVRQFLSIVEADQIISSHGFIPKACSVVTRHRLL